MNIKCLFDKHDFQPVPSLHQDDPRYRPPQGWQTVWDTISWKIWECSRCGKLRHEIDGKVFYT